MDTYAGTPSAPTAIGPEIRDRAARLFEELSPETRSLLASFYGIPPRQLEPVLLLLRVGTQSLLAAIEILRIEETDRGPDRVRLTSLGEAVVELCAPYAKPSSELLPPDEFQRRMLDESAAPETDEAETDADRREIYAALRAIGRPIRS